MATRLNKYGYEDFTGDPANEGQAQKGARYLRNLRRFVDSDDPVVAFQVDGLLLLAAKPSETVPSELRDLPGEWS